MKPFFFYVLILLLFSCSVKLNAQTSNYTWSIKFGSSIPSFINLGNTNSWIDKGKGKEIIFIGLGYKNVHLNLTTKYFTGLTSNKVISFRDTYLPQNTVYKKVFLNLFLSYEYELIRGLYLEPQLGFVNTIITPYAVDNQGNNVSSESVNGLLIGSNLIKYFKLADKFYIGLFFNLNYGFIGYEKVSNDLGGNTLGYSYGFLLKGTN